MNALIVIGIVLLVLAVVMYLAARPARVKPSRESRYTPITVKDAVWSDKDLTADDARAFRNPTKGN